MGSRVSVGGYLYMMNSIFKKMLLLALSFSLGSLLCSSFIIGFLLEKQIYERTKETLVLEAVELDEEVQQFLEGEIETDKIKQTILSLKEQENIQVSIMTEQRKSLFSEENKDVQNWIKTVLDKKSEFAEITFHKSEEMNMFIVGVPILVKNINKGAIFLYTPMKEAEGLVHDINQIIALSVLLLLVPIILVSLFLSKKIVSPIVSMSETVKGLSKGHFEKKVAIKGNDELVSLGKAINTMADQLAVIEQSRKRFIGEISHELRTPFTTIRSTLQGISDEIFSPEEQQEFIQLSVDEIKRISQLIDDLTDLSALEEKAVILQKKSISMSELLETCILQLSLQAKEKEIIIEEMIEKERYAYVDIDRMKQVLINLLDNAIKHSHRQSTIKASLNMKDDIIEMKVENHGDDIPFDILPHLFDRFYKTDQSRSQRGNGLGLTISKKIVELHNGDIAVQSNGGKVIFTVRIPLNE
jgi:signal transduction histidine kinase